jgi:hypothetical protein
MSWTAVAFVPADVSTAYQAAGSPATWSGTVQNRQWHITHSDTGLKSYRWDEVTALGSSVAFTQSSAHKAGPHNDIFNPDYIPPLHGHPALQDPRSYPRGVPTTDAGLSAPLIDNWCECDRYEGPITLGAVPTLHNGRWWKREGTRTMYFGASLGVGAALPNPNGRPEINAAIDLIAYFATNPCTQASLPVVVAFQNAYNASGLPGHLTVDGQYGPNSQKAAQNVMDEAQADAGAGPSQQAPANCFGRAVPAVPAVDPVTPITPSPTPGPQVLPTVVVTGNPPTNYTPYIIGGVAAAGAGLVGYAYWKKHRRGRR